MEWQTLFATSIQHLAWPATVVVIALIVKKKIPDISKFKVRDVEIEFERTLEEIRTDAKASSSGRWMVTSTDSLLPNMLELAEKSPLGIVLQSWDILEQTVLDSASGCGFKNACNASAAIHFLHDNKLIKKDKLNLFFRLYALNKRFSNFENEQLPKERAIETADTALKIAAEIKHEVKHEHELAGNA